MSSIVVGLDLSLTGTGAVELINPPIKGKAPAMRVELIKSKPGLNRTPLAETERLLMIKERIIAFLGKSSPDIVLIEGVAFSARNTTALVQLSGLNYIVREHLTLRRLPFVIVAPTTLKKFIAQAGNAPKDLMLLETYKTYGQSFTDDNICDAHALAQCGLALRGEHEKKLTKPQQEVINLLSEQYENTKKG